MDAVKLEGGAPSPPPSRAIVRRRHPGAGPHRPHAAERERPRRLQGAGPDRGRGPRRSWRTRWPSRTRAASRSCSRACPTASPPTSPSGCTSPPSASAPAPAPAARCWSSTTCSGCTTASRRGSSSATRSWARRSRDAVARLPRRRWQLARLPRAPSTRTPSTTRSGAAFLDAGRTSSFRAARATTAVTARTRRRPRPRHRGDGLLLRGPARALRRAGVTLAGTWAEALEAIRRRRHHGRGRDRRLVRARSPTARRRTRAPRPARLRPGPRQERIRPRPSPPRRRAPSRPSGLDRHPPERPRATARSCEARGRRGPRHRRRHHLGATLLGPAPSAASGRHRPRRTPGRPRRSRLWPALLRRRLRDRGRRPTSTATSGASWP